MTKNFTFERGNEGQFVGDLQRAMNETYNAELFIDGKFGPATERAVRKVNADVGEGGGLATPDTFKAVGLEQHALVDLSDHQAKVDFNSLAAQGVVGVYLKASEGYDWKTKRTDRAKQAEDAGLLVGVYHYGRPDLHQNYEAPFKERENFEAVKAEMGVEFTLPDVYDFEHGGRYTDEWNVQYAVTFNAPVIYTNQASLDALAGKDRYGLLEDADRLLWWAEYTRGTKLNQPKKNMTPWCRVSLWQTTGWWKTSAVTRWDGELAKTDLNWLHAGMLEELRQARRSVCD